MGVSGSVEILAPILVGFLVGTRHWSVILTDISVIIIYSLIKKIYFEVFGSDESLLPVSEAI